jgi:hypothetical protein
MAEALRKLAEVEMALVGRIRAEGPVIREQPHADYARFAR